MKGFTLVELLAVIVILAVITLIAAPIVLSTINDTKESSVVRSAEMYVGAVENKIMQENMKLGGKLNPKECIVNTDGNLTCDGTNLKIEVNGELVRESNNTHVCKLIEGELNEIGSKYECEVKPGTKYNFYVLSMKQMAHQI